MENEASIVLHLPILIICGVLLFATLVGCRGKIRGERSVPFLICLFLWQSLEILFFFMKDPFWIEFIFSLKNVPLAFLPVTFFSYCVNFYRLRNLISKWVARALIIFPIVTSLFAVFSYHFHLFIGEFTVTATGRITQFTFRFGVWYYINLAFESLIYLAIAVIVIVFFRTLPSAYRRGSAFHILYLCVLTLMHIFYYTGIAGNAVDIHYFGLSICGLLFYFANVLNSGSDSLNMDQNSIFDFLDQAVFILNEDGIVVQANRPAVQWLHSLRRSVENVTFDGLLSVLSNNKRIIIKSLEDSDDSDIHIIGTAVPLIYRMERRGFVASDGISKGEFITLTDVTRNRLLIDRLRDMAGVDALTGLSNRYRYQDLLRKLDRNENYPLAIVIGDVNGLKYVNDTYGHHIGDTYIREIANVLMECCPPTGYVARYGGDEFATLLVNCPQEEVEDYICSVNKAFKKPRDIVHQPSIAMGYAIKHHGNENLNALIGQADERMYENKIASKKAALPQGT